MPRYIDADALRARMYHEAFETDTELQKWDSGCWIRYKLFENCIDEQPTISPDDVRGVGKWIRIPGFHLDHEYYPARYQCDQCKHFIDSGDDRNYCPSCGAKMEVSEDA